MLSRLLATWHKWRARAHIRNADRFYASRDCGAFVADFMNPYGQSERSKAMRHVDAAKALDAQIAASLDRREAALATRRAKRKGGA